MGIYADGRALPSRVARVEHVGGSNGDVYEARDFGGYRGKSYLFCLTATTMFKSEHCGIGLSGDAV